MSAENFAVCLALTLGYEGGFSNNPADPGKATMCGITQAVYDDDRDARSLPRQSVRLSTPAERGSIYRRRYWGLAQCDALPSGVDLAVFDFAVNSGVTRAVKVLQGIVGVELDGNVGPYTLSAVQSWCQQYTAGALSDAIGQKRIEFLQSLSTFAVFGKGWMSRAQSVTDTALDMARDIAPVPVIAMATPKTYSVARVVGSVA